MSVVLETVHKKAQLELEMSCSGTGKTVVSDRYMAYPLSVSPIFRLDEKEQQRAYLYRMNTSPGLLAGDTLGMSISLQSESELCLLDQAATKVHTMPEEKSAEVNYSVRVESGGTLEFLPEPFILFAEAALTQTTEITVDDAAGLSLGEIILPGRIARGERYQFREYLSRIKVSDMAGNVWFVENMKLLGRKNRFAHSALFASGNVLGTLLLILPKDTATAKNLSQLSTEIELLGSASFDLACSVLPGDRGLFVRVIAQTTREMRLGFKSALGCVRSLRQKSPMPYAL